MRRVSIDDLRAMKQRGEKFAMLTAYDYPTARLLDEAGGPIILLGDSLGMVVLGYSSTLPVTMADMIHPVRPVVGARPRHGPHWADPAVGQPVRGLQAAGEDAGGRCQAVERCCSPGASR